MTSASAELRVDTIRHDSSFGRWTISRADPPAELAGAVSCLFEVNGRTAHVRERVLPHGGVALLFNLGPPQGLVSGERDRRESFRTAWVAGLQSTYLTTESIADSHLVALRLTPLGAARVLGAPMHELADAVIPLDAVLGSSVLVLREELAAAGGARERLARIVQWTRARLARAKPAAGELAYAAAQLTASAGRKRIGDLRREIGWSERHLAAQFRRGVGTTPKAYARILRFNAALAQIDRARDLDWTRLALSCGYYDQAHLNRDFRALAGASPTAFLRTRVPDAGTPGFTRET